MCDLCLMELKFKKKSCSQGFYFDEKLFIFSGFVGRGNNPHSVCVALVFTENKTHLLFLIIFWGIKLFGSVCEE